MRILRSRSDRARSSCAEGETLSLPLFYAPPHIAAPSPSSAGREGSPLLSSRRRTTRGRTCRHRRPKRASRKRAPWRRASSAFNLVPSSATNVNSASLNIAISQSSQRSVHISNRQADHTAAAAARTPETLPGTRWYRDELSGKWTFYDDDPLTAGDAGVRRARRWDNCPATASWRHGTFTNG